MQPVKVFQGERLGIVCGADKQKIFGNLRFDSNFCHKTIFKTFFGDQRFDCAFSANS